MRNAAKKPPVTPKQFYQAIALLAAGASVRTVAAETGLSRGAVERIRSSVLPKSMRLEAAGGEA